jgi:hypothetical protein
LTHRLVGGYRKVRPSLQNVQYVTNGSIAPEPIENRGVRRFEGEPSIFEL